jgi:hypothetical protein
MISTISRNLVTVYYFIGNQFIMTDKDLAAYLIPSAILQSTKPSPA